MLLGAAATALQREQYTRLMERGADLRIVTASICSGRFATPFIFFVPELPQLSEKENALVELPTEIVCVFRKQTPSFLLEPTMVWPITQGTGTFDSFVLSSERLINAYTSDDQAAEARVEELTRTMPAFWGTLCSLAVVGVRFFLAIFGGA